MYFTNLWVFQKTDLSGDCLFIKILRAFNEESVHWELGISITKNSLTISSIHEKIFQTEIGGEKNMQNGKKIQRIYPVFLRKARCRSIRCYLFFFETPDFSTITVSGSEV